MLLMKTQVVYADISCHSFICQHTSAVAAFTPQMQSITAHWLVVIALSTEGWPGLVESGGWSHAENFHAPGVESGYGHTGPAYSNFIDVTNDATIKPSGQHTVTDDHWRPRKPDSAGKIPIASPLCFVVHIVYE